MTDEKEVLELLLKYVSDWNCASADEYPYFTDELGHACNDAIKLIDYKNKENTKLKAEIEQLKSELEQSVKLPCKCENCKYADFMGVGAERFYCMEHHRYMVVGGYCSFGKSEVSE